MGYLCYHATVGNQTHYPSTNNCVLPQYFYDSISDSKQSEVKLRAGISRLRSCSNVRSGFFAWETSYVLRATCYVLRSYVTNCLYERKFMCPPPTNKKIVTKQRIEGVMFVMLYDISRNWKKKNIIFPKSTGLPDIYQQYTQKQVLDIIREIYIDDNSNRN